MQYISPIFQAQPLLTMEPGVGYLYAARWSPVHPLVFAVTAEMGDVLLFDLSHSQASPVMKLDPWPKNPAVYSMEFNPHQ